MGPEIVVEFLKNIGIGVMWVAAGLVVGGLARGVAIAFGYFGDKIFSK